MTTARTEHRRFGMHANLLYDVITKQAGTLQKAVLEGTMNGIDAGATEIQITLTEDRLTIVDDGKGFKDREEIEQFFETFGTPHQEGDSVFGRFRMGRGQLMSFGRNRWRTNTFQMTVDIKNKGLDYDLEILPEVQPGCMIEIDLYEPLLPSERDAVERELKSWVAYAPTPVFLNGKRLSQDPTSASWDIETDEAWFKLSASRNTLSVYNLGVLVMHAPASRYGTGGIVVSKQRLDVNFARNDVQNDCPVFRAIKAELRKHSDQVVKTKPRISDVERQHLAERIFDKTVDFVSALELKVITDVDGRHHPLKILQKWIRENPTFICVERGDRLGIAVRDQKLAHAIAQETLDRFGVDSLSELFDGLKRAAKNCSRDPKRPWYNVGEYFIREINTVKIDTIETFKPLICSDYESVPEKKLKATQRTLLRAIERGMWTLSNVTGQPIRRLHIGRSDLAEAWTDGTRNIWINEKNLALVRYGYQGCARIAALLLHEYLHEGPDTETHTHDAEFYQRHHDLVIDSDVIGEAVSGMMRYLASEARQRDRKPAPRIALFEDNEARLIHYGGLGSNVPDCPDNSDGDDQEAEAA